MKITGPLLYTMFFFLQNRALSSAKGFLFYKNTKKISEKQIVSFFSVTYSFMPLAHHRFSSHTTSSRGSVMIFLRSYHTLDEAEMCRSLWPEMA